jgi:hypothetical protein
MYQEEVCVYCAKLYGNEIKRNADEFEMKWEPTQPIRDYTFYRVHIYIKRQ